MAKFLFLHAENICKQTIKLSMACLQTTATCNSVTSRDIFVCTPRLCVSLGCTFWGARTVRFQMEPHANNGSLRVQCRCILFLPKLFSRSARVGAVDLRKMMALRYKNNVVHTTYTIHNALTFLVRLCGCNASVRTVNYPERRSVYSLWISEFLNLRHQFPNLLDLGGSEENVKK